MRQQTLEVEVEELGPDEIIREALMLGLRTVDGMNLFATERRAGQNPREGREDEIARAIERGNLIQDGEWLRVPVDRWLKLDGIVRDLF
jgi:coproporphyrinogen III oxidase-like Fe-S oxidoreductase